MRELKLYRPSNGSEGDGFRARFCDRCERDREWREEERHPCPILNMTLCVDTDDKDYPREWRYGADGKPTCTAFISEGGLFPTTAMLEEAGQIPLVP